MRNRGRGLARMEGVRMRSVLAFVVGVWLVLARQTQGIRFVIDKKECWQHEVPYDGDQVRVSYVVIKSESAWSFDHTAVGLDLIVRLSQLNVFFYLFCSTVVFGKVLDWRSADFGTSLVF